MEAAPALTVSLPAGVHEDVSEAAWLRKLDTAWAPRARRRYLELQGKGMVGGSWRWYQGRAKAMRRPLQERLATCGETGVEVTCRCGRRTVPVACGVRWLCPTCQRKTWGKYQRKATRAIAARVAEAKRSFGRMPGFGRHPILVTLTAPHSGDVVADRRRIGDAWRKLRQWMHGRAYVQRWDRAAKGWRDSEVAVGKFDYVLTWEATPGTDGKGHVHAHAVVLWPRTDWRKLRAEWKRAIGDERAEIDLERAGKDGRTPVESAAFYVAKYASKGVQMRDFTPELAAAVIDATYGVRSCSTSQGFWLREACGCPTCREPWRVVERPQARRAPSQPVWRTHGAQVVVVEDWWRWSDGAATRKELTVPLEGDGCVWGTLVTRDNSLERLLIP